MLKRLAVNTGSNVGLMIYKTALALVLTPFLVHGLGNYDYGIWEVVIGVLGYMGLLQVGLTPATSRYAAKFRAEQDLDSLQALLGTATTFMAAVSLLGSGILLAWAAVSPEVLAAGESSGTRYALFIGLVALQVLFTFPGLVFESFLEAYQRYALKNGIVVVTSSIGAALFIGLHKHYDPLLVVAATHAGGRAVKSVVFFWLIGWRLQPGLRLRWRAKSWSMLRNLVRFGSKSFVMGAVPRIMKSTDLLIIAFFLGPASIVFYSLPFGLMQRAAELRARLTHAFMPAFTDLKSRGRDGEVTWLLLNGTVIVSGVVTLAIVGMVCLGPAFIGVWIGPDYVESAAQLIPVMAVGRLVTALQPFSGRLLSAYDEHGRLARAAPWVSILNLVTTIALVPWLGLVGVAAGTSLAGVAYSVYAVHHMCAAVGITVGEYLRRTILPLALPACASIGVHLIVSGVLEFESYAAVLVDAGAMTVAYAVAFWFASLSRAQRGWLLRRAGRAPA